ncbi:ras-domain-containing protein [Trichodelitschia bisporula]|uniref:Ras-domain-containing protein n=1 Tax=Trichodelitschia bisporula TaxID=703511 RepID=A0A6G1HJT1_9PEZI|nr:ras-domain-containing protein [Trichodelitschia bisporula]
MSLDLEAKIVVLGAQGVGKTSLVTRFVKNSFAASLHSTIGASFVTKRVVDIDSATVVRLQIWDTAGQERFRSISKLYYRGANAALLCYDITSEPSFVEMGHWLHELRKNLPSDTILHVVGTKSDIVAADPSSRKVTFEQCIAYVAENLHPAALSSASATSPSPLLTNPFTQPPPSHNQPLASPSSNRSSMGFWGQDLGWDCCHEISASTGEGVEEVFRVITRRLVDQRNARAALEARLAADLGGRTPGLDDRSSFFGEYDPASAGNTGSFRLGPGDRRRSWLGLGGFSGGTTARVSEEEAERPVRKGCC